jgi:EAL domain-containing protein (putative c-di-GMP-specific phosphodiesterase class I)
LAHNLGLRVVAEGVETRETWKLLLSWGCDAGQGYFFAKPMPASELQGWLNAFDWSQPHQPQLQLAG